MREGESGPVVALIDGEHHPAAVRDALDELDAERGVAAVVFYGGEEKLREGVLERAEEHYGRPVAYGDAPAAELLVEALRGADATAVVDLADDPPLNAVGRMRLAACALRLGLDYEAPGLHLRPPRYESIDYPGPKLAVIGTGKRTGKTALAGHWAQLLRRERRIEPIIVAMGRGGPAEPRLARPDTTLDDLLALAEGGAHAASDYLEDAVLAGVPAVGARRVGGGPAGEVMATNVGEAAELAASLGPGAIIFEGSGACAPPVEVDATVCMAADLRQALMGIGIYPLLRAGLALLVDRSSGRGGSPTGWESRLDAVLAEEVAATCPGRTLPCALVPEPAEPLPRGARVALFTTEAEWCEGVKPVVSSDNLSWRGELAADLERAAAERCDVYLTELKGAAVDMVAVAARREGARLVFVRNRPIGIGGADLDGELLELYDSARAEAPA